MTDLSKLMFDSRQNYLKRHTSGSIDLTLGASAVTTTVKHSLGYVPYFIVASELDDSETLWSANEVHAYTQSSLSSYPNAPPQYDYWSDDDTLTIRLTNGTGTGNYSGQTRTVYWVIYLDYPNF